MTAVYVLRHPQTTWNVAERYQGRLEAELSAEGERQCRLTVAAFGDTPLDAVYSSPLRRAMDLARGIADITRAPLTVDQRLTEIAMGPWEGLYRAEIRARFPELFEEWYVRPHLVRFPEGEDLAQVRSRSESALSDFFRRHPNQAICVVTHSSVIQMLAATALGLDLRFTHRVHISNAGITTLCGHAVPGALMSLNVTDHVDRSAQLSPAEHRVSGGKQRLAS
jgi:broad specificity phosphatase PhoE